MVTISYIWIHKNCTCYNVLSAKLKSCIEIRCIHMIKPIIYAHVTASYSDFKGSIQTVRFSSKQSTATVYIKIKDDKIVESTEAFQVAILIPHYLYLKVVRFGSHSKAKVYIKDGMKAYNIYCIATYICLSFR